MKDLLEALTQLWVAIADMLHEMSHRAYARAALTQQAAERWGR